MTRIISHGGAPGDAYMCMCGQPLPCGTTRELVAVLDTWDITPTDPDYSGPRITLTDPGGGEVMVARADDPRVDPWVLIPVTLLRHIDMDCIRSNGDRDAAGAFNSALAGAFPDGPPGGCGGFIDMPGTTDRDALHGEPAGDATAFAVVSDDPELDCPQHGFVYKIGRVGCPVCVTGTSSEDDQHD